MTYNDCKRAVSGWHLDKRVSLGHLITTAVVSVSLVVYLIRLEGQVEQNEISIEQEQEQRREADARIEQRLGRTETRIAQTLQQIRDAIVRIEKKLDDKADKAR